MRQWKALAHHRHWVEGPNITELCDANSEVARHRFVATIRGYGNWKIWHGETSGEDCAERVRRIQARVQSIRDRIDAGDESVFHEHGAW